MNDLEVAHYNEAFEGFAVAHVGDGAPVITEVGMHPELHHTTEELAGYLGKVVQRVDGGDVPAGNLGFTKWSTQDKKVGITARITHAEAA